MQTGCKVGAVRLWPVHSPASSRGELVMSRPAKWKGSDLRTRSEIVRYLHDLGGELVDPKGLASRKLQDALGKGRAISQLLADMEADKPGYPHMIEREVRGRRTYAIRLVDDWGLLENADSRRPSLSVVPSAPDDATSMLAGADLELLADALLAIVVKRASQPVAQPADTSAQREIAKRLRSAEAALEKVNTQLRTANEGKRDAEARVAELAGQVTALENNLALLQKELTRKPRRSDAGGGPIIDRLGPEGREVLKNLMSVLPETPQSKPRGVTKKVQRVK